MPNPYLQAASAFSSTALDGPVNVEKRILRNPVLTAEDPPFELPWLLNHGKVRVWGNDEQEPNQSLDCFPKLSQFYVTRSLRST